MAGVLADKFPSLRPLPHDQISLGTLAVATVLFAVGGEVWACLSLRGCFRGECGLVRAASLDGVGVCGG